MAGIWQSPFVKSIIVGAVGVLAPAALDAIDHPTGGLATALSTNPAYAASWTLASYFAHNIYSAFQAANTPTVAQSSPLATTQAVVPNHPTTGGGITVKLG